ncbi:hypothetical protein HYV21_02120 [Candidatus Microgenomates bacterium]|nr:hypothetical protein [Candidatus Microgenomates bacterium]
MSLKEGLIQRNIEYLNRDDTVALLQRIGIVSPVISDGIRAIRLREGQGIQLGETDIGVSCELIEGAGGILLLQRVVFRNGLKKDEEGRIVPKVLVLRASKGRGHSIRRMLIGFYIDSLYEEYNLNLDEIKMTRRISLPLVNQTQPV